MAVFDSRPKRLFKKIQKLAQDDMVDQAAVMIEDDMDVLMEDKDVAKGLIAFLMDIGHPDLAARLSEGIIKSHPELKAPIKKLLEDRHSQFTRSFELLRAIWHLKLKQREFSGMVELLNRVDRMTEARMMEVLENAVVAAERYTEKGGIGSDVDRFLSWSIALYRKGRVTEAMDLLVSIARKSMYPSEALIQLSAWIVSRNGGSDPSLYLSRIRIFIAMSDYDKAISELSSIFDADEVILEESISIVEKEIIPEDDTAHARVALARLLSSANRPDDSCRILEELLEKGETGDQIESAAANLASTFQNLARPLLLLARIRRIRGEQTGAIDAIEKAFAADDIVNSPVIQVCREFLADQLDREDMIARFLSGYLVDHGSIPETVEVLSMLVERDTEWVTTQLQLLLARDRKSAAVLALLAVVMLITNRNSEAKATLSHLSGRTDLKSRQDILQVLDRFDSLMNEHPELRRVRAAAKLGAGSGEESATDWFELLLAGEKVPAHGMTEILTSGLPSKRAQELLESEFIPGEPLEAAIAGSAALGLGDIDRANQWLITAAADKKIAAAVVNQVKNLPEETLIKLDLARLLPLFNDAGLGKIAADIMSSTRSEAKEPWRSKLVYTLSWDSPPEEMLFRLDTHITMGRIGMAGSAGEGLAVKDGDLNSLAEGCRLVSSGRYKEALYALETAASSVRTSSLSRKVLEKLLDESPGSEVRIVLAETLIQEDRFSEGANSLRPVLRNPEVREYLQKILHKKPGATALKDVYARSLAYTDRFDDFRVQISSLLDITSDNAGDYASLAMEMGNRHSIPEALIYAATLSDRFNLDLNSDQLLQNAIQLKPVVARRFEGRAGNSPSLQVLCSIAEANATDFASMMKRHDDLEIAVTGSIIDTASREWKPEDNSEALYMLSRIAVSRFTDHANEIRGRIALSGTEPWKNSASNELYEAMVDGKIEKNIFWTSVRSPDLVAKALNQIPLEEELKSLSVEEIDNIIEAVSDSGLDSDSVAAFGMTLIGSGRKDLSGRLGKLAKYCHSHRTPGLPENNLIRLLIAGRHFVEASNLALTSGDDELLSMVREGLTTYRIDPGGSKAFRARAFLLNSQPEAALSEFSKMESEFSPGEMDILAYANWKLGRRETASRLWLKCYRISGDGKYLARLQWALDSSGCKCDRNAVKRLLEERHPEIIEYSGSSDRGLDLIAVL